MFIPQYIQDKIIAYQGVVSLRFSYFRLSDGYNKSSEAQADTTPSLIIYTLNNLQPDLQSTLFIDTNKINVFAGNALWYHAFSSTGTDLNYVIKVTNNGIVGSAI